MANTAGAKVVAEPARSKRENPQSHRTIPNLRAALMAKNQWVCWLTLTSLLAALPLAAGQSRPVPPQPAGDLQARSILDQNPPQQCPNPNTCFINLAAANAWAAAQQCAPDGGAGGAPLEDAEAPQDIVGLLADPQTRLEGLRKLARWAGLWVPESQIRYENVDYLVVDGNPAGAITNMKTGTIIFSNAVTSDGNFWITLSYMKHEYAHWMDATFGLGYSDIYEIRAYGYQVRDIYFERTPAWYQDGVRQELKYHRAKYECEEKGLC